MEVPPSVWWFDDGSSIIVKSHKSGLALFMRGLTFKFCLWFCCCVYPSVTSLIQVCADALHSCVHSFLMFQTFDNYDTKITILVFQVPWCAYPPQWEWTRTVIVKLDEAVFLKRRSNAKKYFSPNHFWLRSSNEIMVPVTGVQEFWQGSGLDGLGTIQSMIIDVMQYPGGRPYRNTTWSTWSTASVSCSSCHCPKNS